jgi:hypothetical protein
MMPHKFDVAITEYREAHQWCEVLPGDALSTARDEEMAKIWIKMAAELNRTKKGQP